jgi:phosphoenolpyruvate-protein phosphotransferase
MINILKVYPPLDGVLYDIATIPDEVFATKSLGDGVAIDPLTNKIYAPITGKIKSIYRTKHAIIIASNDIDVLVHIGLDTVSLNGIGFNIFVSIGDYVKVGDIIGEFDLDHVATYSKSLITPVITLDLDPNKFKIKTNITEYTDFNSPIFEVIATSELYLSQDRSSQNLFISDEIFVLNPQGIHARPAAQIANQVKALKSQVYLEKNGVQVDARSIVQILGLAINQNDKITIKSSNKDHIEIISKLIIGIKEEKLDCFPISNNYVAKVEGYNYYGMVAVDGIAIGKLCYKEKVEYIFDETSTNIEFEINILDDVYNKTKYSIQHEINNLSDNNMKSILKAHLAILEDPTIYNDIINLIQENKTVGYSINQTFEIQCNKLSQVASKLINERQSDLNDIKNRLLSLLILNQTVKKQYSDKTILIADDFTPSDIISLDKNIVGLVSVKGGTTSHVSILAKNANVPLLVGVNPKILYLTNLNLAVLNAVDGYLNVAPESSELDLLLKKEQQLKQIKQDNLVKSQQQAITLDGVKINCLANIANLHDAKKLLENGADGVGLFRTEFIFMGKDNAPSFDEQFTIYKDIITQSNLDYPFVIRTLDIGADKQLSYLDKIIEYNPILGLRGIRLCLHYKELFITQLKAILLQDFDNLKIMIPMISDILEFREVKQICQQLISEMELKTKIELGIMVEVPSVAIMSDIFAKEVDFFSIGTNDLTQYTLAIDRENSMLAKNSDHLHPAVLRNIKLIIDGAKLYQTPVSVCGEMASELMAIIVLIGLGLNSLSMNILSIADNKAFIRNLSYEKCKQIAENCLQLSNANEVRLYLQQFILN